MKSLVITAVTVSLLIGVLLMSGCTTVTVNKCVCVTAKTGSLALTVDKDIDPTP